MAKPSEYDKIVDLHRNRLERVAERRGVGRMKKLYDAAQEDMARKMAATAKRLSGDSFTMHAQRVVMAQLKEGQTIIMGKMAGELDDHAREAQVESLRSLSDDVRQLEGHYTGAAPPLAIDEAARFAGVIDKRKTSLMRQHKESMAYYGADIVSKVEEQLALSVLQAETPHAAIDRVLEVADGEWYQGERIVRTETSWATNATKLDGVQEIIEELPDMMIRWTEHVTDEFEPMDDRVGVDSIAMHGQVIQPGGYFVMPDATEDGDEVSDSLVGNVWQFPPDRPNDRAVIAPWRQHWGGMAWRYSGGGRIFLSR